MKNFAGWPHAKINAAELGMIAFNADGFAVVSEAQAEWLTGKIEAGALVRPSVSAEDEPVGAVDGVDTVDAVDGVDTVDTVDAVDEAAQVELVGTVVEKAPKAPKPK
jgi:hypothetical protein